VLQVLREGLSEVVAEVHHVRLVCGNFSRRQEAMRCTTRVSLYLKLHLSLSFSVFTNFSKN
jgi:hypothetical protein